MAAHQGAAGRRRCGVLAVVGMLGVLGVLSQRMGAMTHVLAGGSGGAGGAAGATGGAQSLAGAGAGAGGGGSLRVPTAAAAAASGAHSQPPAAPSPSATVRCEAFARGLAEGFALPAAVAKHVVRLERAVHIPPGTPADVVDTAFDLLRRLCRDAPVRAFVTYSDGAFERARTRLVREAAASGDFEVVVELTPGDMDEPFRARNAGILQQRRGAGFWLWKPWAAARVARLLRANDFLVYLDAGCKILRSLQPWLDAAAAADPGWHVLEFGEPIARWTKGDIFEALGVTPAQYGAAQQVLAGVWAMRVTPASMALLERWLALAQDAQLITDAPSRAPNPPGFSENRHDQSIFSLLVRLHNVTTIARDNTYPEAHARQVGALIAAARSRD
jgi:hypothetical protein